jgi:hypothetical protein
MATYESLSVTGPPFSHDHGNSHLLPKGLTIDLTQTIHFSMDKTTEGAKVTTFYGISFYKIVPTIYGHDKGPGDLLSRTCAPQYPSITNMSRDHRCRDAEPCEFTGNRPDPGNGYRGIGKPVPDAPNP